MMARSLAALAAPVPGAPGRGATVAPGLVREGLGLAAREPVAGVARKLRVAAKGGQPRAREGLGMVAREPMAGVARKLGAAATGMQPRALVAS